jgi:hypothetical protein
MGNGPGIIDCCNGDNFDRCSCDSTHPKASKVMMLGVMIALTVGVMLMQVVQ